jgi:hypothetical protein
MSGALRGYASLPPAGLTAHAVLPVGMSGALRGYASLPPPGLTAHAVLPVGMSGALRGYASLPPPGLTAHALFRSNSRSLVTARSASISRSTVAT